MHQGLSQYANTLSKQGGAGQRVEADDWRAISQYELHRKEQFESFNNGYDQQPQGRLSESNNLQSFGGGIYQGRGSDSQTGGVGASSAVAASAAAASGVGNSSQLHQHPGAGIQLGGSGIDLDDREKQYLRIISEKMRIVEEYEQRGNELRQRRANLENNLSLSFAKSERNLNNQLNNKGFSSSLASGRGGIGGAGDDALVPNNNSHSLNHEEMVLGEISSSSHFSRNQAKEKSPSHRLEGGGSGGGGGGSTRLSPQPFGNQLLSHFQPKEPLQDTAISLENTTQSADQVCTFQPAINQNATFLSNRGQLGNANEYAVQYLYSDALDRKQKKRHEQLAKKQEVKLMTNRSQIDQKSQKIVYKQIESTLQSMLDALDDAENKNFISFENVGFFLEQLGVFKALQFKRSNDETSLFMADRAKVDVQRLHREMLFHENVWRILGTGCLNPNLVPTRSVFDFIMILLENQLQVKQAVALLADVIDSRNTYPVSSSSLAVAATAHEHQPPSSHSTVNPTTNNNQAWDSRLNQRDFAVMPGTTVHEEIQLEDREDEVQEAAAINLSAGGGGGDSRIQNQNDYYQNFQDGRVQKSRLHRNKNNTGGDQQQHLLRDGESREGNYFHGRSNGSKQQQPHQQQQEEDGEEEDSRQQHHSRRQQNKNINNNNNNNNNNENFDRGCEMEEVYYENDGNDQFDQDLQQAERQEEFSEEMRQRVEDYQVDDEPARGGGAAAGNGRDRLDEKQEKMRRDFGSLENGTMNSSSPSKSVTGGDGRGESKEWSLEDLVVAFRKLHDDKTSLMEWYSTRRDQLLSEMSQSSQVNHTIGGHRSLNSHTSSSNKEQTFHPQINQNSRNLDKALNENYISKIILNSTNNPEKLEQFQTRYDLLYEHSQFLMEKREEKKLNQETSELDECSFVPSINQSAVVLTSASHGQLPEKVPIEEVSQFQYKKLSGAPAPNNNDNNTSSNGGGSCSDQKISASDYCSPEDRPVYDRLYQISKFKNEKIKECKQFLDRVREDQEIAECTFQPNINRHQGGWNNFSNASTYSNASGAQTGHSIYDINGVRQSMTRLDQARREQNEKELFWERQRNQFNNHDPSQLTQYIPFEFQKSTNQSAAHLLGEFLGNVDVNLSKGQKGRITIHRGDDPEKLAANFAQIYSLNQEMQFTLQQMISQHMKQLQETV